MAPGSGEDSAEEFEDDDEQLSEDEEAGLTVAQLDARRIRDPAVRALLVVAPEPPSLASKEDLREVSALCR